MDQAGGVAPDSRSYGQTYPTGTTQAREACATTLWRTKQLEKAEAQLRELTAPRIGPEGFENDDATGPMVSPVTTKAEDDPVTFGGSRCQMHFRLIRAGLASPQLQGVSKLQWAPELFRRLLKPS